MRTCLNTDHKSQGPTLGEWASLCAIQCGQTYRTGEFSPDAFWRTLVADSTTMWRSSPAPDSYHIPLARFISNMVIQYLSEGYNEEIMSEMMATGSGEVGEMLNPMIASIGRDSTESNNATSIVGTRDVANAEPEMGVGAQIRDEACGALSTNYHDRTFFVTDGHFIGIGPSDAEIGDEVHILAGGNVPFIFRKVKKREEQEVKNITGGGEAKETRLPKNLDEDMRVYRMLGETYVHGLMKGEALELEGFEWSGVGIL